MNPTIRKSLASAAVILAGAGIGLTALGNTANAADTPSTTVASATAAPATDAVKAPTGPHQANGITETPLVGDELSKATAAAATAVPGSTVVRAETDADGDSFEVHITNADGTQSTVKLNADFSLKTVETGHAGGGGKGGHGNGGHGNATKDGQRGTKTATATTATTTA